MHYSLISGCRKEENNIQKVCEYIHSVLKKKYMIKNILILNDIKKILAYAQGEFRIEKLKNIYKSMICIVSEK